MKKFAAIVLAALVAVALFANGTTEEASSGFTPEKDVSWVCTSKPGGGSDIFTTQIKDAMKANGITNANIVTDYITDGSGEVGRLQVATTNKAKADYTLLTFNSGDLMPMVKNTEAMQEQGPFYKLTCYSDLNPMLEVTMAEAYIQPVLVNRRSTVFLNINATTWNKGVRA